MEPAVPEHFPDWPQRHPSSSPEQIELGRWLFYDTRLSIDGSRSCGICHEQVKAFSDGLSRGLGIDNALLSLNSPSLFNIAWRTELTWYQQFGDVESHMWTPLFIDNPMELEEYHQMIANVCATGETEQINTSIMKNVGECVTVEEIDD